MPKVRNHHESHETPLETYLREINEVPLLTADEEVELANKIAKGNIEARQHMIRANLRLVVSIARGYVGKGMPMQDLIEEGNIGLITAVEKFDPAFKTRFSTYANYWIKQNIQRALINEGTAIRIPAYMQENIAKWRKLMAEYKNRGIHPKPHLVMKRLELSQKQYDLLMQTIADLELRADGAQESDTVPLAEMAVDNFSEQPGDIIADEDETEFLHKALRDMDKREAKVLKLRFGLNRRRGEKNLREVGEEIGVTRERVRQIENQAVKKLGRIFRRHRA